MTSTPEDELVALFRGLSIRPSRLAPRSTPSPIDQVPASLESPCLPSPLTPATAVKLTPDTPTTTSPSTPKAFEAPFPDWEEPTTPDRFFSKASTATPSTSFDRSSVEDFIGSTPGTSYTSSSSFDHSCPPSPTEESLPNLITTLQSTKIDDYQANPDHEVESGPFGPLLTPPHSPHLQPTHDHEFVTPTSCLQCVALGLPCSKDHPNCTRCTRRLLRSSTYHSLLHESKSEHERDPCIAMRERTPGEIIRGEHMFKDAVLADFAWEDKEMKEVKRSVKERYEEEAELKEGRRNWALPMPEEGCKRIGALWKIGAVWTM